MFGADTIESLSEFEVSITRELKKMVRLFLDRTVWSFLIVRNDSKQYEMQGHCGSNL
jgi:hypothetical protein